MPSQQEKQKTSRLVQVQCHILTTASIERVQVHLYKWDLFTYIQNSTRGLEVIDVQYHPRPTGAVYAKNNSSKSGSTVNIYET